MQTSFRISVIAVFFFVFAAVILMRLFYWQVINASSLSAIAASQRESISELAPIRGNILASDGFPLAINQTGYLAYANPQKINVQPNVLAQMLTPILQTSLSEVKIATDASKEDIEEISKKLEQDTHDHLLSQLSRNNLVWVLLKKKLTAAKKTEIENLHIEGINFETEPLRTYPEASMAAHILGFVGQDDKGKDVGYFGLEGFYNLDLSGRMGIVKQEKDAINRPIPIGKFWDQKKRDGRHLKLYLDRSIQYIVEDELEKAVQKYGAKSGSVLITDPKTGGILAMASWPSFEPSKYGKYGYEDFVNPLVSKVYEPGSTFKVLTMSAGINEGLIEPSTACDICDRPYKIGKYLIHTWNDEYTKNSTMTEVLIHSDNVGMIYVAKKLGLDNFLKYINGFGIGQTTGIDIQGESAPTLRDNWGEVDLYTAAFGQGLVVNGVQMAEAVGAIANEGKLMEPHMVEKIIDSDEEISIPPKMIRQVISPQTAKTVTEMMVASVDLGEAKWSKTKGYKVAGKTGTAQISAGGKYNETKTIASFVGFAPADDPKFLMLTILDEPTSSEWGSETAAPLFFHIAKRVFVYLGIAPTE